MTSQEHPILIGDIGGTNARFALTAHGESGYSNGINLKCADYESADDAIANYLAQIGASSPDVICLAVAAPVIEQTADFTNNHWHIVADELANRFEAHQVRLINDFEAIAHSLPLLDDADLMLIGERKFELPNDDFTFGVIGPGTGLGQAGLIRRGDQVFPIPGEASHAGFAPETQQQIEILQSLRTRFERVSEERLVSGAGIENIYWAVHQDDPARHSKKNSAEIFAAAIDGSDEKAVCAVDQFFEILGQIAGDLALSLNATDGIFIAGGIIKRYPELLARSCFRKGFESKGRYKSMMEKIPTQLILHADPGLLGASHYARELALKQN